MEGSFKDSFKDSFRGQFWRAVYISRINHVQGTRPNAVSAFRTFAEYIFCAYTRINKITFTYYTTSILYSITYYATCPG